MVRQYFGLSMTYINKIATLLVFVAIPAFPQLNSRQGPYSTRPAASSMPGFTWQANDCLTNSPSSPCVAGGGLFPVSFLSDGTNWNEQFYDYTKLLNLPPVSGVGVVSPALISPT